jgi:hypothetical protein
MRFGRLQASTLSNIWKSLDPKLNDATLTERVQKQYLPSNADSPLFRLVSVPINEDAMVQDDTESFRVQGNDLARTAFSVQSPRVASVPNLSPNTDLDEYLPVSRTVQSTGNLFTNTRMEASSNHTRLARATLLNRSASFNFKNQISKKSDKSWDDEYAHIDIDWSMQAMDVLYNASFYDYIKDERNVDLSAIRLSRIIKDYKPKQVANALLWMIQGWSVENTAKLLRVVFADWLPDLAGCVFSLICHKWPKNPQSSLCVAYILLTEPSASTALFLRSLTQGWCRKESIDLITYLDAVLKWDTQYLQEVMTIYTTSLYPDEMMEREESSRNDLALASQQLVCLN